MQATFYNFSKRKNSTAIPSDPGTSKVISLKQACGIINPIITIAGMERPTWNYCKLFDRYYFCSDWLWNTSKLWECNLHEDFLGSLRGSIFSTTAFVSYADQGDPWQVDGRFQVTKDYEFTYSANIANVFNTTSGIFVIGLINSEGSEVNGALATYALTWVQMRAFSDYLNTDSVLEALKTTFTNPYEAVVFCNWLPVLQSAFTGTIQNIRIAGKDTGIAGLKFTNKTYDSGDVAIPIPWGDLMNSYRCSPYTTLSLYLPFVGLVNISSDVVAKDDSLYVEMALDTTDGSIVYRIKHGGTQHILATYGGSCGASIPISRQQQNYAGAFSGVTTMIGGAATVAGAIATGGNGALIAGGLGAIAGGGMQTLKSAEFHTQTNGALSSRVSSAFETEYRLFRHSNVPNYGAKTTVLGMPLMRGVRLGNLSGYVQTIGASIQAYALEQELDSVNTMLDNGIYIE